MSNFLNQYPETNADSILRKTFELDAFLASTGLFSVLTGYTANTDSDRSTFNYRSVQAAMRILGDDYANGPIIESFVGRMSDHLFELCFDSYFIPYISSEFRQSFNNMNVSHTTDLKKRLELLVQAINPLTFFENDRPNVGAVTSLPTAQFFAFGEGLYNLTADFNADSFKQKIAPFIVTSFQPYLHYQYLSAKLSQCNNTDQRCKRVYTLGRLIFIYFTCMSLFLIVFSSAEKMKKYKIVTNENDALLNERKKRLLHLMDSILSKLGEPAMQNDGDKTPTDVAKFYSTVKQMSLDNVQESNDLSRLKSDLEAMQNNLSNYNQMEGVNAKDLWYSKMAFVANLVSWSLVVVFVIGLTVVKRFRIAEVVSWIAVVFAIVLMLGYVKVPWQFFSDGMNNKLSI
jgi:hypothetical protein